MKVLVTGACGFVGSTLLRAWIAEGGGHSFFGVDNFVRPGSELNRTDLRRRGVALQHADLRNASDFDTWPAVDVVVDAAANPSVLAGIDGRTSSRQLLEHNLVGTINLLEYCRQHRATFILLSTSRVYAIAPLATLPVRVIDNAFEPDTAGELPAGVGPDGVSEAFATTAPVSLYGATKLASEQLALEYGFTFDFPVWINRCGVMAGAGQFGRPDQGIFAYWINSWLRQRPLKYIGFGGSGHQVRDCLHPADLVPLLERQSTRAAATNISRVVNISGGRSSAMSLNQLSRWCVEHIAPGAVASSPEPRPYDLPWVVLDSARAATDWQWTPRTPVTAILAEILVHAETHPDWLELSAH